MNKELETVVASLSDIADQRTADRAVCEGGDASFRDCDEAFEDKRDFLNLKPKTPPQAIMEQTQLRYAPSYALVNGEKVVVSVLKNGTKVFAAGDADGKPLVVDGRQAVIDPVNGRLRFRVKHEQVMNPAAVEFEHSNGLECSQAALALLAPAFMSFVKAVKPVKNLYRRYTRAERFKMKCAFFIASAMVAFRKFFKRKPKVQNAILVIDKLNIPLIHSKQINTLQYEIEGTNKLAFARWAAMRVPLNPDGSIPQTYIERWENFLYDMSNKGIWKYGVLAPPAALSLPFTMNTNLHYEKVIFTSFFTDQMPADNFSEKEAAEALNKKVGFDVFVPAGELPISSEWSKFPW